MESAPVADKKYPEEHAETPQGPLFEQALDAGVPLEPAMDPRQWLEREGEVGPRDGATADSEAALDPAAARASFDPGRRAQTERDYPLYGVAFHYLAQVHPVPDTATRPVGYVRRGTQFRARRNEATGKGCADGFFELAEGGFVCRGEGFLIGETPRSFTPAPPAADRADALPYAYRRVAQPTFQFWRAPTELELVDVTRLAETMDAERRTQLETDEVATAAPSPSSAEANAVEGRTADDAIAASPWPDFVRFDMPKGFYVSVPKADGSWTAPRTQAEGEDGAAAVDSESAGYATTLRGALVPDAPLAKPVVAPESYGVALSEGSSVALPLAFVPHSAQRYVLAPQTGKLAPKDELHRTAVAVVDQLRVDRETFLVEGSGDLIKARAARVARRLDRPAEVPEGAQWIHVDLGSQTLVAYEGDEPVFATLVATGKRGFETPEGIFKLESKHVSVTMDGEASQEERYRIEDVPFTMYFSGSYALHGAFWHDRFGAPLSHGCVNLTPADARWLFDWSTPGVASALHGRYVARGEAATFVVITGDKAPQATP